MNIEKLKSGSYRIRQTYKGVKYSVTVDHKPTQKECIQLMSAELNKTAAPKTRMSFKTAAEDYIDTKRNVLSPATISGYESILRRLSEKFKKMIVTDITSINVQKEINAYSAGHSAKTVKNMHGFITAVLSMYAPNTIIRTTLPQRKKSMPYIPTDDDIRLIVREASGTKYQIPIILALFGLRRSEICALTMEDIGDGTINVNKAVVPDGNGNWIVKGTKTTDSTRTVTVTKEVTDMIKTQGYVYKGHPNSIYMFMRKIQKKLGLQQFSLHKLRHYYASLSSSIGVPDAYIMAGGGWKTDNVLKSVYRHALSDKTEEMLQMPVKYIEGLIS